MAVTQGVQQKRAWSRLLAAVGIAILAVQVVVVVGALAGASWWFSWGPNDYLYQYRIDATVAGKPLDAADIEHRYHVDAGGIYENPIDGLLGLIRTYESTYGRNDRASVVVRYRLDNGREHVWQLRAR